jgi:UDP:flavonoid glycosyltransferase YjiC (YdhE family)
VSSGRFLVAAFGDPGHAFPAIALARALARRGNEVTVETWEHWREAVEDLGVGFTAAEEYQTFPPPPPDSDGPSAADAALALLPMLEAERFHVVVSDILTLAPALAAERAGLRRATLVPHVYPVHQAGLPFFAFGALPARTALGRALWRGALPVLVGGLERGRDEYNRTRAVVGLAPTDRLHGGISEELALVATFPQLEYPRRWPAHVHVTGPMEFELPYPDVELPPGDDPLVLVAPSTAQDPDCRLVRVALDALADDPVRVLATTNRHLPAESLGPPPANAAVVDWLSYTQAMSAADLVICHGGHGTVARALGAGVPVICCPAVGDMAENGARVAWAGAGLMLPWRLVGAASLRAAVRRTLADSGFAARASGIAAWSSENDGATRGAELVERVARTNRSRQSGDSRA